MDINTFLKLLGFKTRSSISLKYLYIPPTKFIQFPKSFLKHIQFFHDFLSGDIFYSIHFWNFGISIHSYELISKSSFFVKLLENMAGVMSMKTHLKCVLGCSGKLDLGFLLIDEICHDVHKWSGSTLSSISCQTFTLSLANSYSVELCPNLW